MRVVHDRLLIFETQFAFEDRTYLDTEWYSQNTQLPLLPPARSPPQFYETEPILKTKSFTVVLSIFHNYTCFVFFLYSNHFIENI